MAKQSVLQGLGAPVEADVEMSRLLGVPIGTSNNKPEPVKKEPILDEPEPEVENKEPESQQPVEKEKPEEVIPQKVENTPEEDPWIPVKERFKERAPQEVLAEWDQISTEREELKTRLQQKEDMAKELQDRLVYYDVRNDPDYIKNVIEVTKGAEELLIDLFIDRNLAEEALKLHYSKEMDSTEKKAKLKEFLADNMVSQRDFLLAIRDREQAKIKASEYEKNWASIQQQKQKEAVQRAEVQAQENVERLRRTNRTAIYKAEQKIKELGIDYVEGFEDAKAEHLANVERIIEGRGTDIEQDILHNIIGRMVLKSNPNLKAAFKKLSGYEASTRAKPKDAPKETGATKSKFDKGNPVADFLLTK